MPITRSAKKALRKDRRKTIVNLSVKRKMKAVLQTAGKNPIKKNLALAYSAIDRAVKKKIVPRKKAARLKSRIARLTKKPS